MLLTSAYTVLVGSPALRLADVTLIPAALAIVAVSSYRLASDFLTPSLELLLGICAASGARLRIQPSLLLIAGGPSAPRLVHGTRDGS